jgi:site-specific recombinase XerD
MEQNNWILDPDKFLSKQEAERLLNTARQRAQQALDKRQKVAIRDYFIIHLALSTGLRVMEIAKLNCGDLFLKDSISSLVVRRGKGSRKRQVLFNGSFAKHCRQYLQWKRSIGEPTELDEPLFLSSNTKKHMTERAIQKAFKRCAEKADIALHYSIHCLRHTYACQLYKASSYSLRLVQKQLGHARISTTEVYADVMKPDVHKALRKLCW